jgi:hypothetical protein
MRFFLRAHEAQAPKLLHVGRRSPGCAQRRSSSKGRRVAWKTSFGFGSSVTEKTVGAGSRRCVDPPGWEVDGGAGPGGSAQPQFFRDRPTGRTSPLHVEFEVRVLRPHLGSVAQSAEPPPLKRRVAGSTPAGATLGRTAIWRGIPSRKRVGSRVFGGSNPSPSAAWRHGRAGKAAVAAAQAA